MLGTVLLFWAFVKWSFQLKFCDMWSKFFKTAAAVVVGDERRERETGGVEQRHGQTECELPRLSEGIWNQLLEDWLVALKRRSKSFPFLRSLSLSRRIHPPLRSPTLWEWPFPGFQRLQFNEKAKMQIDTILNTVKMQSEWHLMSGLRLGTFSNAASDKIVWAPVCLSFFQSGTS